MNQCVIIGNLTSDPELRQTPNGKSVVKFTVAVNNGKDSDGKDRPADFITCQAWNKTADLVGRWWTKGKPIAVIGAFKTDKYRDKKYEDVTHYNSYILVNSVEFVGGKGDGGQQTQATPAKAESSTTPAEPVDSASSEDCPF
jgi:single-strand DNA-binding protein